MDRRRVLLIIATVVALLGTALVYLYVRSVDDRAETRFDAVNVLRAVAPIQAGETIDDAQAAGKIAVQPVSRDSLVPGYQTSIDALTGQVAVGTIYPGEQIIGGVGKGRGGVGADLPRPAQHHRHRRRDRDRAALAARQKAEQPVHPAVAQRISDRPARL